MEIDSSTDKNSDGILTYGRVLERFRGARVYFERLPYGNNGDLLLEQGSKLVHGRFQLEYTTEASAADLVIIRGSGSMVEFDKKVLGVALGYARELPQTPLCIEPSFYFYEETQLRDVFPRRSAPTYLFARDRSSFDYLRDQATEWLHAGLDHDMSLALRDGDLIRSLKGVRQDKVLIVDRNDVEHPMRDTWLFRSMHRAYKRLPVSIRNKLKPVIQGTRSRAPSRVKRTAFEIAATEFPELADLPRVSEDISEVSTHSFEQFLEAVASSAAVLTTRLHVGFLAAMLDKPTVLLVRDFPKIQRAYDFSLRELGHVQIRSV